jgi:hypothetical protein
MAHINGCLLCAGAMLTLTSVDVADAPRSVGAAKPRLHSSWHDFVVRSP